MIEDEDTFWRDQEPRAEKDSIEKALQSNYLQSSFKGPIKVSGCDDGNDIGGGNTVVPLILVRLL